MATRGHEIVPVSRRRVSREEGVVSVTTALSMVASGRCDLIINAATRGSVSTDPEPEVSLCRRIAFAAAMSETPTILISSTRVLEGYSEAVDEAAKCRPATRYAKTNALCEYAWLKVPNQRATILRATNLFFSPTSRWSSQNSLLPWSVLREAVGLPSLVFNSGPESTRTFISIADLVDAILRIATSPPESRICCSLPGLTINLRRLSYLIGTALAATTGTENTNVQFGEGASHPADIRASWLSTQGWTSRLGYEEITREMIKWLDCANGRQLTK